MANTLNSPRPGAGSPNRNASHRAEVLQGEHSPCVQEVTPPQGPPVRRHGLCHPGRRNPHRNTPSILIRHDPPSSPQTGLREEMHPKYHLFLSPRVLRLHQNPSRRRESEGPAPPAPAALCQAPSPLDSFTETPTVEPPPTSQKQVGSAPGPPPGECVRPPTTVSRASVRAPPV